MMIVIDNDSTSLLYDQLTQLEGREYLLQFLWSDREGCWYLNVSDQDGNLIAAGCKLVLGKFILRRFKDPRLPPGALFCFDNSGANLDIADPTELGQRVELVYATSDDEALV